MVTLEAMARFSMHAFHRHGQALFRELPKHIKGGKRQLDQDLDQVGNLSTYFAATDGIIGEEMEQIQKELSPTYERLENVAERSVCEVFYDLTDVRFGGIISFSPFSGQR